MHTAWIITAHRLPDPLLTAAQFERWTKASEIRDGVERVQEVARLVAALPPANRAVLAELTRLLHMVHLNFEVLLNHFPLSRL
jgi:hypothetical protein